MRNPFSSLSPKIVGHAAIIALLAGAGAACSNDATRLSTPIFTNSTGAGRTAAGGDQPMPPSVVGQNTASAVTPAPSGGAVTRTDLAPPPGSYDPPASTASAGHIPPTATGSHVATAAPTAAKTIKVESGETIYSIARRYNVSPAQLMKANNLQPDSKIKLGQSLTIPGTAAVKVAEVAPTSAKGAPAKTATDATPATRGAPPTTLGTIPANHAGTPTATAAVTPPPPAKTGAGDKVVATNVAATKTGAEAAKAGAGKSDPQTTASVARVDTTAAAPTAPVQTASLDPGDTPSADGQQFRWPVRGRIISGFGTKPNGEKNDGINLAVPEGTSVKAAEAGTVIYSGNEIAGYGNLVLIRHAGGWVSAYAHNSSILVKRGDTVKRGQIVANAGATGSVTSPQVHFELRRGSNPVNPLDYLAGA